jgi:hypothetical protein
LDEGIVHEEDANHSHGQQGNSGAQVSDPRRGGQSATNIGTVAGWPPIITEKIEDIRILEILGIWLEK